MSWQLILKNNSGLDEVLNLTSKSKALKSRYGANAPIPEGYNRNALAHRMASLYEVFNKIIEDAEKKQNYATDQKDIEEGKKGQQLLKELWKTIKHPPTKRIEDYPQWADSENDGRYFRTAARSLPFMPDIKPTDDERVKPKTYDSAPEVSSVVSQYFKMYKTMGKGIPTVQDIEEEEGRMLTEKEIEYYQFLKESLQ